MFPLLDKKTNVFLSEPNVVFINLSLLIKIFLPKERSNRSVSFP